ncbi:hypothetical protein [Marinicrinis lubricantis]|uniref:LPXTG cell wall anchor domain-containing protein n=1 Tax=Marinicrinis lubricantis TaxID=2086470 RepID=A0ABW1IQ64_9BACL
MRNSNFYLYVLIGLIVLHVIDIMYTAIKDHKVDWGSIITLILIAAVMIASILVNRRKKQAGG